MSVGFEVYNEDGSIQFDTTFPCYQFKYKGSVILNRRVYDDLPAFPSEFDQTFRGSFYNTWRPTTANGQHIPTHSATSLIAFRPRAGFQVTVNPTYTGGLDFIGIGTTSPVVDYWVFGPPSAMPLASGIGIETYDENGGVTFSNAADPMRIVNVVSESNTGVITAPVDGNYAVCIGGPYPNLNRYSYNSSYSKWSYTETNIFYGPPTARGFPTPSILEAMGRDDYYTPSGAWFGNMVTALLIDVGGL